MTNHEPDIQQGKLAAETMASTSVPVSSISTIEKGDQIGNSDDELKVITSKESEYPSGSKLLFISMALVLAIFLASLDMTIVATAIPKITDEFGGIDKVSWYGSAFFMTNGGFQSSWGKAYKYFPLKTTFLASVFIFELGSLVCGVAPNPETLIVGRAITGLGASGLGTGVYTIIAIIVEPIKRARYTGIVGSSYGVAAVVGPLIGGAFTDKVSWRWCFYINLPIGGVSALIIFFLFHTPSVSRPVAAPLKEKLLQMDFVGVAMVMGALVSYTLALQYAGQSMAWRSSTVIGLLLGFIFIVIAFVFWEYSQGERAIIPFRLIKMRSVGVSSAFTYFFSGPYYLIIYYLPIYFQSIDNANAAMSGVYTLPLIVPITTFMILSGSFITATGHAVPMELAGSAIAIIAAGLIYTLDVNTSTGKWVGYQIIAGLGWGLGFQVPIVISQASADPADLSSITAIILFFMCLGGTTMLSAAQSAFVNTLVQTLATTAPEVSSAMVVATGATELRSIFSAEQIPGVLEAYMAGLKVAFALSIATSGLAFIVSLCNRWKRLNAESAKNIASAA